MFIRRATWTGLVRSMYAAGTYVRRNDRSGQQNVIIVCCVRPDDTITSYSRNGRRLTNISIQRSCLFAMLPFFFFDVLLSIPTFVYDVLLILVSQRYGFTVFPKMYQTTRTPCTYIWWIFIFIFFLNNYRLYK